MLPEPLAHPGDADSSTLVEGLFFRVRRGRYIASAIFDLKDEMCLSPVQTDDRLPVAGMTSYVRQCLLNHAEKIRFQLERQTADIVFDFQEHFYSRAPHESFDVPIERTDESEVV